MPDIETIRALCTDESILMTQHVVRRCQERGIPYAELLAAVLQGQIIEQYPDDSPCPSCLILGPGPLHIVAGVGQDRLWIITAYRPGADKWENDWKTRKGGGA